MVAYFVRVTILTIRWNHDRTQTFRPPRRRRPRLAEHPPPFLLRRLPRSRSGWAGARCASGTTTRSRRSTGFPPHPHADMEIITYVRQGAITHKDSLGNEGRTEAGDVQVMSAGTGIRHAEYNLEAETTTLFQIWIIPTRRGGDPRWGARPFPKERARRPFRDAGQRLRRRRRRPADPHRCARARRDAEGRPDDRIPAAPGRHAYLVPASGAVAVNGVRIGARDGAAIRDEAVLRSPHPRRRRAGAGRLAASWSTGRLRLMRGRACRVGCFAPAPKRLAFRRHFAGAGDERDQSSGTASFCRRSIRTRRTRRLPRARSRTDRASRQARLSRGLDRRAPFGRVTRSSRSPEIFIAFAAERTRHIRLGTGVISLPYHHPMMVADRIVQLDHMTRGRVMFGAGPGLLASDAIMLGIDPMTQRDRMAEALDVILRLFRGEIVTEKTDWYTMEGARLHLLPYTKPYPEMAVVSADHAVGRAARRQIRSQHDLRRRDQPVRLRRAGDATGRSPAMSPPSTAAAMDPNAAAPRRPDAHRRDPREGLRECPLRVRALSRLPEQQPAALYRAGRRGPARMVCREPLRRVRHARTTRSR